MFSQKSQTFYSRSRPMKDEWTKILGDAVWRRVFPRTNLTLEQLAHAIGCSVETLRNLLRQQHATRSDLVARLINFFASAGDHGFLQELYPNAVTPLIQKSKRAERALAFVEGFRDVLAEAAVA